MNHLIVIAAFACLVSCDSDSKPQVVSKTQTPSEVVPILTNSELERLGFGTKDVRATEQSKWDQEHFGTASIIEQDIKSLKAMAEHPSTFPRYTIIRETYESHELAAGRLKRLRDHDPSLNSKMHAGLVLRDGFATDKDVWIVTTDAVIFSHQELAKVKGELEELKKR